MKKTLKNFVCVTVLLLLCSILSACGDITDQDPSIWPKKGPAASVPQPESYTVNQAVTKVDNEGKAYAIILLEDFDANDMSSYINLLADKGYETVIAQRVQENFILYSAKKGKRRVLMKLDTEKSSMKLEIE